MFSEHIKWVNKIEWGVHWRFREDIEHRDAFGRFRRIQVVQSRHCVYNAEHHAGFHPVVHQVHIRQTRWDGRWRKAMELGKWSFKALNVLKWVKHIPIVQSERCFSSFMSLGRVRMYMKWKLMATMMITPKCNKAWMEMVHISLSLRLKSGLLACLGQEGMTFWCNDWNSN